MSEETPKMQPDKSAIDEKRKNALLRYVAILFVVAFVLVLFSMITQMRDSRHTISQLNQSSTSALQKAEQLQDTNRVLEENNEFLKEEIAELNAQLDEMSKELEEARESAATQEDLKQEQQALEEQLTAEAEAIRQTYELLLQLQQDPQGPARQKLETLKNHLGPKGLETYESILMEEGE